MRQDRYAASASAHDFLLSRVADDFAERLSIVRREFPVSVNFGAYHGGVSRRLRQLPNVGSMFDVEASSALLAQCDGPRLLANSDALPFGDATLDLAVSGLALHLVNDVPGTLAQLRRALKPDGLLLVAMLGGETLKE